MKVAPQSSLISIITVDDNGDNLIVFGYLKQLSDINPPDGLLWKEPGSDIWAEKKIKQWLTYGSDQAIEKLWQNIITGRKVKVGEKEVEFKLPENEDISESHKGREFIIKYPKAGLPQFLKESVNTRTIEGYTGGDAVKINPIQPPGLFEEGFLNKMLAQGCRLYKLARPVNYLFRGTKAGEDREPTEIVGFVQESNSENNYHIEIFGNDGELAGKSYVDRETGVFKVKLDKAASKGRIILKNGERTIDDHSYVLLKGVDFNVKPSTGNPKDSWKDRNNEKEKPARPVAYTWQKDLIADEPESIKDISTKLKELINYLGPDILICDPYFLGKVPPEKEKERMSYKTFMNVLFSGAIDYQLSSISFLGHWAIAKRQANKYDDETMKTDIAGYVKRVGEDVKKNVEQINFEKFLNKGAFSFYNAKKKFHNRYWFGMKKDNKGELIIDSNKVFIVTISINGLFKHGEVDIIPCTEELQTQRIASKYQGIFGDSLEKHNFE